MTAEVHCALRSGQSEPEDSDVTGIDNIWTEQFISRVSHETRTPLNAILGFSGLMSSGGTGDLTSQQKELTRFIEEAGEKLFSMICDLTDLARHRIGRLELDIEPVDLTKLMSRLDHRLQNLANQNNMVLTVLSDAGLTVWADRERLYRVLYHLASNAIQHNPSNDFVAVSASEMEDGVHIAVSDSGKGYSKEETDLLFEFFRCAVDQSRCGTGLELPISHFLINAMGGKMSVETHIGSGSTFTIILNNASKHEQMMP